MTGLLGVARSGVGAVLLHPMRSVATVAAVTAMLVPFITGLAVSEGLLDEARDAARFGADLVVTGTRFGRPVPVPTSAAETLRAIPSVTGVRPRIVGAAQMGAAREDVVIVGLDPAGVPGDVGIVEGRLFAPGAANEVVVGSRLAARLGLSPGARIPPFYSDRDGERWTDVVGVFRSDLPMWEANVVLAPFETAQRYFDERGSATQLLVTCQAGYSEAIRDAILRMPTLAPAASGDPLRPRVFARSDVEATLARGAAFGAGVFALHFVLLFAAAVPLLVVATGAGLRERRRETGILKMLGWGTDDVLVRAFVESLTLAVIAASLSVIVSAVWLGPAGGRGISAVMLPGADANPGFGVPWRLTPGPVAIAAAVSLALVLVGTLPSSWRAASAEPMEAMR